MSNLTFAEAMALDPSEVEYRVRGGYVWVPFCVDRPVRELRSNWEFRRARPRKSRVQEMAEAYRESRGPSSVEAIIELAIRAVCEYLGTSEAGHMINHDLPGQVEREFLEPR